MMIYMATIACQDEEGGTGWIVSAEGETMEAAIAEARAKAARYGEQDEMYDPLQQFIRSLPERCRNSFHLLDVLGMFQVTTDNVLQKDTPHGRAAIITEVLRRENQVD